jgi:2-oxoglutarate ferredoxin oxidoreductase subunit alpha
MLYVTGADLISAAAIRAGCNFFAGYPITPASSILHNMLRLLPRIGGVGIQAEDEISSISMCIGAAMAGRRPLTATSGPGMSLYSENIGLAQMAEVPLVIVNVQRMGPATGGATTNAEGDVQFVRWVTSGGYPLVVYAPCDLPSTYSLVFKAFDTAERLRTPVVLLTSKTLVMAAETVSTDNLEERPVASRTRGNAPDLPYRLDALNDVPPFLVFGDTLTRFTTSIHDERGIITEEPAKAERKLKHLIDKIEAHAGSLAEIDHARGEGDTAIVCYGSPARSARVAVRELARRGESVSLIVLHTLSPFPEEALRPALEGVRKIIVPELNRGLLVPEIERIGGGHLVRSVTRLDGGLIDPQQIVEAVLQP